MYNIFINVKLYEDFVFCLWDYDVGVDRYEKSRGIVCNEEWVVEFNVMKFSLDVLCVRLENVGLLNELEFY